ncbi:hypothetical protein ACOMHN_019624 [Nucella lapillus]
MSRHLGTAEQLNERCRQTYTLEVRFRDWEEAGSQQTLDMLRLFLTELFPNFTLLEHFHTRALFMVQCPSPDFSLASTFETLETIKRNLDLEELTFSQCSVDQLFLDLSRQQRYGDGRYVTLHDLLHAPTPSNTHPLRNNSTTTTPTEPPVDVVSGKDPSQLRKDGGGASGEGDINDNADAAVGMVVIHHSGDDDGGGVAGVGGEGERQGAGAANPVRFTVDGEDNPAFVPDDDDDKPPEVQTVL